MNNETPSQKAHRRLTEEILMADFECVDNCRIARKSDPKEMADYEEARSGGCCGFFDREILVNGEVYLIGCNYGH